MVSPSGRSWRSRKEVPREFRERCSLERFSWGALRFLLNAKFELSTETIGTCVQEDCLWIADPKAINHILQKSGYVYAKPSDIQELIALVADRGVGWAEGELSFLSYFSSTNDPTGDVHKRHRRAMAPAFGLVGAQGLLPYFMNSVAKVRELRLRSTLKVDLGPRNQMADKWSDIVENDKSGRSAVIDVYAWFGKATLDA